MKKEEIVVLYHAYGSATLHQQVLFSILTLHYHLKGNYEGVQIVIYTDNAKYYSELIGRIPVLFEMLTTQLIDTFKGENRFIHRVKIAVIKDCFERYKKDIFYLDSDTYFTEDPKELFNKINATTSVMNSNDYDLNNADELFENADWLLIRRAIRDFEYEIEGSISKIPLSTRMWNAGVIGISYQNKELLDKVLNLTDQIYNNRQVFTAEQFAFSYFLQTKTNLISSGEVIFHYWPNFLGKKWKDFYSYHFQRFFRQNKKLDINEKAKLAFELTTKHHELTRSVSQNILDRLLRRVRLASKILLKGKI